MENKRYLDKVVGSLVRGTKINYDEEEIDAEFTEEDGGIDTSGDSSSTNANVSTWETGLSRGPANQITVTIWNSNVNRGKGNMLDQNSKWESGVSRGKSNPLT